MRTLLQDFKANVNWPQCMNMTASDARWLQYLNQASQRLMSMATWKDTTQRYAVCVFQGCLTWARQFETILAMDVCNRPITQRPQWHEFLDNGPGLARPGMCNWGYNSYDRGSGFVMFDDLRVASKIRLYPQFAADVGKTVTIRGLDDNMQQVLTDNGNIVGEVITLALPYVDSDTTWGPQVFREVIKEATKGHVLAYGYDASLPVPPASPGESDTPLQALADWEPTETLPDYRRSYVPALDNRRCNCTGDDEEDTASCSNARLVTIIAKLKFIKVESDLDFLPISNESALKLAMIACMLEDRRDYEGARLAMYGSFDPMRRRYIGGAVPILEDELDSWQGAGTVNVVRLEGSATAGPGVFNMI